MASPKRVITTLNSEGKSVFDKSLSDTVPLTVLPNGTRFGLCYATTQSPVEMNGNADIEEYSRILSGDGPGLMIPGGTVLRQVDLRPGRVSSMHRTNSLDYGIVMEGEIDLLLDSGETTRLRRGDIAIQRGTMHTWKNASDTQMARMLFVLVSACAIEFEGKMLEEDVGGLPIKASSQGT